MKLIKSKLQGLNLTGLNSTDLILPSRVEDELDEKENNLIIHLRLFQRNGRKCVTTITGLPSELDFNKLVKEWKKRYCCNGHIVDDEEFGKVIQLSGDQRQNLVKYLTSNKIAKLNQIKVHGV